MERKEKPISLYPEELSFRNENKIKSLPNERKTREFPRDLILKSDKEVLQAEGK